MIEFLLYLLKVSVCHSAFYFLYKLRLEKLIAFRSNRFYLLFSTLGSFIIPLLTIEVWPVDTNYADPLIFGINSIEPIAGNGLPAIENPDMGASLLRVGLQIISFLYLVGMAFFAIKLFAGLRKIHRMIRDNQVKEEKDHKIVHISEGPAFFSFGSTIFINETDYSITEEEVNKVILHERVHVREKHTWDLLLLEAAIIVCWFNPFLRKIKKELIQVHEYQADNVTAAQFKNTEDYSTLILKLASARTIPTIAHQFSFTSTKNRINMLHQKQNTRMKNLRFLLILPLLGLLMSVFSFTEKRSSDSALSESDEQNIRINSIKWEGNTAYSDKMLSNVMGLKEGDSYHSESVDKKIRYSPERDDIGALYIDNGYAYFQINVEESFSKDKVDLTFRIHEGKLVSFGEIRIQGTTKRPSSELLELITLKKGELFNRSKLIESQKILSETGWFVADKIMVNPIPVEDSEKMDIEFVVIDK